MAVHDDTALDAVMDVRRREFGDSQTQIWVFLARRTAEARPAAPASVRHAVDSVGAGLDPERAH